jgi:hypothetical protein
VDVICPECGTEYPGAILDRHRRKEHPVEHAQEAARAAETPPPAEPIRDPAYTDDGFLRAAHKRTQAPARRPADSLSSLFRAVPGSDLPPWEREAIEQEERLPDLF